MFGLSSLATKMFLGLVLLGIAFAGGVRLESKVAKGKYETLVASYKDAQAKALQAALDEQKRLDAISQKAAEDEAAHQQQLAARTRRQLAEVRKHVKVVNRCVPYGLVRVLDAASSGRLTDSLPLPTGKSDAACAPVGWDTLAGAVTENYGTARSNAEQLDALIKFYRDTKK
jgi:hypothetical protein